LSKIGERLTSTPDFQRDKTADKYGERYYQEPPQHPTERYFTAIEHNIKKGLNPLTDIARIIKELPYGQMVGLVDEIKSVGSDLEAKSLWDWACKRVQGDFDVSEEEPN